MVIKYSKASTCPAIALSHCLQWWNMWNCSCVIVPTIAFIHARSFWHFLTEIRLGFGDGELTKRKWSTDLNQRLVYGRSSHYSQSVNIIACNR